MPRRIYVNTAVQASLQTALSGDGSETQIDLDTVSGWPVPGTGEIALGILNWGDSTKTELFSYTGISGTSLTGVILGVDGTSNKVHDVGAPVRHGGSALDIISARMDAANVTRPSRSLNSNYQPNVDRPVDAVISIRIEIEGSTGDDAEVEILIGPDSGSVTQRMARQRINTSGDTGTIYVSAPMTIRVPPGWYINANTLALTGSPGFTLLEWAEFIL